MALGDGVQQALAWASGAVSGARSLDRWVLAPHSERRVSLWVSFPPGNEKSQ